MSDKCEVGYDDLYDKDNLEQHHRVWFKGQPRNVRERILQALNDEHEYYCGLEDNLNEQFEVGEAVNIEIHGDGKTSNRKAVIVSPMKKDGFFEVLIDGDDKTSNYVLGEVRKIRS